MTRASLIRFFFFSFLSSSYFYSCLAISFFFNFICHLLTIYLSLTIILLLLLLLFYYHCYDYCYFDTIVTIDTNNLQLLYWLILPVRLFLRKKVRESSKQGIQAAWSTPIHHLKWRISRFRGIYRTLAASEAGLFLILLKGLQPLCDVTRRSVLVPVDLQYRPLHFIIVVMIIAVVMIVLLTLFLLLISFLLFQLLL